MKHTAIMLLLGAAAGTLYAQTNDSISLDSLYIPKSMRELEAIEIEAERPLYSVDGEKQLYNVGDDPSVQTGTASSRYVSLGVTFRFGKMELESQARTGNN